MPRTSDIKLITGGIDALGRVVRQQSAIKKRDAERKEEKMRRDMLAKEAKEYREGERTYRRGRDKKADEDSTAKLKESTQRYKTEQELKAKYRKEDKQSDYLDETQDWAKGKAEAATKDLKYMDTQKQQGIENVRADKRDAATAKYRMDSLAARKKDSKVESLYPTYLGDKPSGSRSQMDNGLILDAAEELVNNPDISQEARNALEYAIKYKEEPASLEAMRDIVNKSKTIEKPGWSVTTPFFNL